MCEPTTAAIVLGAAAVGGLAAADETNAANNALDYNAGILDYNAQVAEIKADKAIESGAVEESRFRDNIKKLIGEQRAGFASSGVVVGEGTAGDVVAETAMTGEEDALTIRYNAELQAFDFKTQAQDFRNRAKLERSKRRDPVKEGFKGFLTGVTQLGSTFALTR